MTVYPPIGGERNTPILVKMGFPGSVVTGSYIIPRESAPITPAPMSIASIANFAKSRSFEMASASLGPRSSGSVMPGSDF